MERQSERCADGQGAAALRRRSAGCAGERRGHRGRAGAAGGDSAGRRVLCLRRRRCPRRALSPASAAAPAAGSGSGRAPGGAAL